MTSFYVINAAGEFYRHLPGELISWGPLGKANDYTAAMSAGYAADKYPGSRVVEVKGKKIIEVTVDDY